MNEDESIILALRAAYPSLTWTSAPDFAYRHPAGRVVYHGEDGSGRDIRVCKTGARIPWWADAESHPPCDIDYEDADCSRGGFGDTALEAVASAVSDWDGLWESKDARLAYWTGILEERCGKLSVEITRCHVALERMARKARDA